MVLAIDIGGTYIRIADVSGKKVRNRTVIKTPSKKTKILESLVSQIKRYGTRHLVCISVAGFVKDGKVVLSPNVDLNDVDLKKYLEGALNVRVYVQNDAKCAAIAENYYGLGTKYKDFVYLTIGTGIGGAIMIDNALYEGHSFAGEFGHMIVTDEEFEKSSSGKAFTKMINHKTKRGAYKIIQKNLSTGILNIIYALDPEAIIIGGGYGSDEVDVQALRKEVLKKDLLKRKIDIKKSALLGDDSLIGAAILPKVHF